MRNYCQLCLSCNRINLRRTASVQHLWRNDSMMTLARFRNAAVDCSWPKATPARTETLVAASCFCLSTKAKLIEVYVCALCSGLRRSSIFDFHFIDKCRVVRSGANIRGRRVFILLQAVRPLFVGPTYEVKMREISMDSRASSTSCQMSNISARKNNILRNLNFNLISF